MLTPKQMQSAFRKVKGELADLGLLAPCKYLDQVGWKVAHPLMAGDKAAFVYDEGVPWYASLLRDAGTIYVNVGFEPVPGVAGATLTDLIRHEFAHAWAYVDRERVDAEWFHGTFGGGYKDLRAQGEEDYDRLGSDPAEFKRSTLYGDFISAYALRKPAEDFAETFGTVLRFKNSLDRFQSRKGAYQKLLLVRDAIRWTAEELDL